MRPRRKNHSGDTCFWPSQAAKSTVRRLFSGPCLLSQPQEQTYWAGTQALDLQAAGVHVA
jgi:hypothetical protein